MGFFRKEEDELSKENEDRALGYFKTAIELGLNAIPGYGIIKSVDALNADIDEATKKEIEKTVLGRAGLAVAPKLESAQRTIAGAASDVGRESLSLVNLIADKTNLYEVDDELLERQEQFIDTGLKALVGEESVTKVNRGGREVSAIKEPEYAGGEIIRDMTAILGSVFAGTKGLDRVGKAYIATDKGKKLKQSIDASRVLRGTTKIGKSAVAGEIGVQFSVNPYEDRLANIIGEFIADDEGALNDVLKFLEADDNKTELENRAGLAIEGLAFTIGLPAAYYGSKAVKETVKNKDNLMKALKEIKTKHQKGSLDISGFKDIMTQATKNAPENLPSLKSAPDEDVSKLWQFSSNKLKRGISKLGMGKFGLGIGAQEFFKSRGYFTPKVFELFNKSEAAKNAWADAAENYASGLDKKIKDISAKYSKLKKYQKLGTTEIDEKVQKGVNDALKNDEFVSQWTAYKEAVEFKKTPYGKKSLSKDYVKNFNTEAFDKVPKELRDDVAEMRILLDDFSEVFLQMPNNQISKELKETIEGNLGKWLHTSYDIFESSAIANRKYKNFRKFREAFVNGKDDAYKAIEGSDVFLKATASIRKMLSQEKKYGDYDDVALMDEAMTRIEKLLGGAAKDSSNDYFARMDNFYGSNRNIFKRKGDIDEPLKDLMGEIKNPSVNVLKSVTQVSSFVEDYRFSQEAYGLLKGRVRKKFDKIQGEKYWDEKLDPTLEQQASQMGQSGRRLKGHVFNKEFVDTKTGIRYTTPLRGKQYGVLNGKFMTEEMAMMFGERQGLIGQLDKTNWYKSFLALKGYGQASKTVLNHITHLRNTIGGAFFTLANGNNPFSGTGKDAAAAIYNRRFKDVGKKEALDYYNKLVSLDLVNTGARYGDIQELMKESAGSGVERFLNNTTLKLGDKGKTLKKWGQNIQDAYIAEDDFFKIISFEQELDSLIKQAKGTTFRGTRIGKRSGQPYDTKVTYDEYIKQNPEYLQRLEKEAAKIVRNTVPTYSLVPTGIKQLRKLPFGNYFSFPAEMVRTSYGIVEQGLRELFLSGGGIASATRMRGARRLGGFMGVGMFGNEGLSELTKRYHGVTDEEEERLRHLNPYDYAKNSKFIFYRDKKGGLYKNDFSFIDPYDTIKRPLQTAIINFAHGKKTEENLAKIMGESMKEGLYEYTKPFYSEAMFTKAIMDINRGATSEGYPIKGWKEGGWGDKAKLALYELYRPFVPGALQQVPKTAKAFMGDEYEKLGDGDFKYYLEGVTAGSVGKKEYTRTGQVIANLTGFRFEKVDVEGDLGRKAKQYLRGFDDARKTFDNIALGPGKDGNDFLRGLSQSNKQLYYVYKDLKLAVDAARYFDVNSLTTKRILEDAGIDKETILFLNRNRFKDYVPSEEKYQTFLDENLQGPMGVHELQNYVGKYNRIYSTLPMINISFTGDEDKPVGTTTVPKTQVEMVRNPTKNEDKLKEILRKTKVEGGLVKGDEQVPYTKENPSDRVDPFTGLPYSDQMNKLGFGE